MQEQAISSQLETRLEHIEENIGKYGYDYPHVRVFVKELIDNERLFNPYRYMRMLSRACKCLAKASCVQQNKLGGLS